jgi:hypothetical protein
MSGSPIVRRRGLGRQPRHDALEMTRTVCRLRDNGLLFRDISAMTGCDQGAANRLYHRWREWCAKRRM